VPFLTGRASSVVVCRVLRCELRLGHYRVSSPLGGCGVPGGQAPSVHGVLWPLRAQCADGAARRLQHPLARALLVSVHRNEQLWVRVLVRSALYFFCLFLMTKSLR